MIGREGAMTPVNPRRSRLVPPPERKTDKRLIIGLIGGGTALGIVAIVVALSTGGREPEPPPPPPVAVRPAPRPVPPPSPPPLPPPAPRTLRDRMAELAAREKASPRAFRDLHALWSSLLPEAKNPADETEIRGSIERLESEANKAHRELYRPVQQRVRDLLGERRPREARQALLEWKVPESIDIGGGFAEAARREIAAVDELIAVEDARGKLLAGYRSGNFDADPDPPLAAALASGHVQVRAEAERTLWELRSARGLGLLARKMDARRAAATARVEAARAEILQASAAEKSRVASWEKRLQEETRKRPLSVRQLGVDLEMPIHVSRFDGREVTFAGQGYEARFGLDEIPAPLYGQLLAMAPHPSGAAELMEAGRLAVRRGVYDVAQRLFDRAVRADPSLRDLCPDLGRLRTGVGLLRGAAQIAGDTVTLAYEFKSAAEKLDFVPSPAAKVAPGSGPIAIRGTQLFYATPGQLKFNRRLKVACEPDRMTGHAGWVVGAAVEVSPGEFDLLVVVLQADGGYRVARLGARGGIESLAEGSTPAKGPIEVVFDAPAMEVRVAGGRLWSGATTGFSVLQPLLGANDFTKDGGAEAAYRSFRVEGRATPLWLQRLHSERLTLVESELSKERRTTKEERGAGDLDPGRVFGKEPLRPHPLEAELGSIIPAEVAGAFRSAREAAARLEKTDKVEAFLLDALQVTRSLDQAVAKGPWLPLGFYYRAEWRYSIGDLAGALDDLGKAVALQETFVEARLARADLLMAYSRNKEAERELDLALAAVPDLARARLSRALLHYISARPEPALAELELAMRLEPGDLTLRRAAKRLANVVAGPRWGETVAVETPHYLLRAEAPRLARKGKKDDEVRARVERYAAHLEAAAAWFPELAPGKGERPRKPVVYFFDTPESYYVYADLAQDDRLEHTAGLYMGLYRQMLFHRAESEEETLWTMAHEAFHEHLHAVAPGAPVWLNEGLAEYAAGIVVREGRVVESGLVHRGRLRNLQDAFRQGWEGFPFDTVLRETPDQFYKISPELQYAQAWSMVHFLRHADGGRRRPLLEGYVKLLVQGKTPEEALKETFDTVDLQALRREWRAYVLSLR